MNQSQEAILVRSGKALDLFSPGAHTIQSANVPLLEKLVNWPFDGKTPVPCEVWFINRTVKRDLRWGTAQPIGPLRDPVYDYPVSLRANGLWGFRVIDSRLFVGQIVGTQQSASSEKIHSYFIGEIQQKLGSVLAKYIVERKISILEIAAHLNDIAQLVSASIANTFATYGLEIVNFDIVALKPKEDEEAALKEALGRGLKGVGERKRIESLAGLTASQAYIASRSLDAADALAENLGSSGAASGVVSSLGAGLGLGAGLHLGDKIAANYGTPPVHPSNNAPAAANEAEARLTKLRQLLDAGLLSQDEYNTKRAEIIRAL